jgi:microcystin-dependent protein
METFLGSLLLVPYNFVPQGWALCNGQQLSIAQNNALFALLGATFGGDGVQTFALPNLTGAKAITDVSGAPLTWIIALTGIFPTRG